MARRLSWWLWRRQQQQEQPAPVPTWPVDERGRPPWATEQQQILPAVDPPVYVVKECGDMR